MADNRKKLKLGTVLEALGYTPQTDMPRVAQSMYTPYDQRRSAWRNNSEFIDYYWEPKVWDERTSPESLPKKSNQNRIFSSIMNDRLYKQQRDKLRAILRSFPKLPNIK